MLVSQYYPCAMPAKMFNTLYWSVESILETNSITFDLHSYDPSANDSLGVLHECHAFYLKIVVHIKT